MYVALTASYKKGCVPKNRFHQFCYSIVTSTLFESIIYIAIIINTVILALQHYQMSHSLTKSIYWINVGFTVLFTLEAILKLVILRPTVSLLFREPLYNGHHLEPLYNGHHWNPSITDTIGTPL